MNTPVVVGKKLKKSDAYIQLATHINVITKAEWTAKTAKSRYDSYIKIYKSTKRDTLKTGWGLTEDDVAAGIATIPQKLEKLCPFSSKLDILFGERQNVNPSSVFDGTSCIDDSDSDSESPIIRTSNATSYNEILSPILNLDYKDIFQEVDNAISLKRPRSDSPLNSSISLEDAKNKKQKSRGTPLNH